MRVCTCLSVMLLGLLPCPLAGAAPTMDPAAMRAPVVELERKLAAIKGRPQAGDLQAKLAALKASTDRVIAQGAKHDALVAREGQLKLDVDSRSAAVKQFEKRAEQATADVDARLAVWSADRDAHNASQPGPKASAGAVAAYKARAKEGNAQGERLRTERDGIVSALEAERKSVDAAFETAQYAFGDNRVAMFAARKEMWSAYGAWQEQYEWLSAAADVVASGADPAGVLKPFPGGVVAPADAGLAKHDAPPPGTNVGAMDQLRSVAQHSGQAATSASKGGSSLGIDTAGRAATGAGAAAGTVPPRTAPAFVARLPAQAKADPQVKQSLAWYQKVDALKADAELRLTALKKAPAATGDAVAAAKLATVANEIKRHDADLAAAKTAMAKRVKYLGFEWEEAPPAPPPAGKH